MDGVRISVKDFCPTSIVASFFCERRCSRRLNVYTNIGVLRFRLIGPTSSLKTLVCPRPRTYAKKIMKSMKCDIIVQETLFWFVLGPFRDGLAA